MSRNHGELIFFSKKLLMRMSWNTYIFVAVHRKIGHSASPIKFFCTYLFIGSQILSFPSCIVVASIVVTYRE